MLESLQARKINAIMWQAVPIIDNTLCKKCSPCSTAGMWFEYFIWMSTCDARDSELEEVGRTEIDKAKYYFITPD